MAEELVRHPNEVTGPVVRPAVIGARQARAFHRAERERKLPVRTAVLDRAQAAVGAGQASSVSNVSGIVGVEALLALQDIGTPTERKRRAVGRAARILDVLDEIKVALLDGDRFEGRFRDGVHGCDPSDLIRRMTKEGLLKFDGTPLFPERIASTVGRVSLVVGALLLAAFLLGGGCSKSEEASDPGRATA